MSHAISSAQLSAQSLLQFSLQPSQRQGVFASVDEWENSLASFELAIDRVKGSKIETLLLKEIEILTHSFIGGAEDLTAADTTARIERKIKELREKIREVNNTILKNGSFLMKLSYYLDWDWLKKKSGAPQIHTTRMVDAVRLDLNKRKIEREMQQLLFPAFPLERWATGLESAKSALARQAEDFPVAAKFPRFQLYQEANGERHILAGHDGALIAWKIEPSSKPGLISLYEPKSGQRMECDPYVIDAATKKRGPADPKQLQRAFEMVCGEHVQDVQKKLPAAQARQNFADLHKAEGLYSLREMGLRNQGSITSNLPAITNWAKGLCKGQAKSHFIVTNNDNPADPKTTFLLVSYDPGILKAGFTFLEVDFDNEGQEILNTLLQEKSGRALIEIEEESFDKILQTKGAPLKLHVDKTLAMLKQELQEASELLQIEQAKIKLLAKEWKSSSIDAQKAAFLNAKRKINEGMARVEQTYKRVGIPSEGQLLLSAMQRELRVLEMRLELIAQIEQFFIKAPQQKAVAEIEKLYSPLLREIERFASEAGAEEAGNIHALLQPVLIGDMIPLWMDEVETKMLPAIKAQIETEDPTSRVKLERQYLMLSMQHKLAVSWREMLSQSAKKERLEKIIGELDRMKIMLETRGGFHANRDLYYQCTFNSSSVPGEHGSLTRNGQEGRSLQKISLTAAAIGLGFMISSGAYYYGMSASLTTSAALSLFGVGAVVAAQPYLPDSGDWQVLTQAAIHIGVGLAVMAGYRAYNPIPWHSPAAVVDYAGQAAAASAVVESAQATASRVSEYAWSFFANPPRVVAQAVPVALAEAPFIGPQYQSAFVKPEPLSQSKWIRPPIPVRPNPSLNVPLLPAVSAKGHYWRVLRTAIEVETVGYVLRNALAAAVTGAAIIKG